MKELRDVIGVSNKIPHKKAHSSTYAAIPTDIYSMYGKSLEVQNRHSCGNACREMETAYVKLQIVLVYSSLTNMRFSKIIKPLLLY